MIFKKLFIISFKCWSIKMQYNLIFVMEECIKTKISEYSFNEYK